MDSPNLDELESFTPVEWALYHIKRHKTALEQLKSYVTGIYLPNHQNSQALCTFFKINFEQLLKECEISLNELLYDESHVVLLEEFCAIDECLEEIQEIRLKLQAQ